MKVPLSTLTDLLIKVSDKAATIARSIRSEQTLFELLIQEKTGIDKNKRFVEDFKTLTDVLVQEVVKHDIGEVFPGLAAHIQGEESNTFTNLLGETITVEILDTPADTAVLLAQILDNNERAAGLLASLVHEPLNTEREEILNRVKIELTSDQLGIWIDPIDSTSQYIHGRNTVPSSYGIHTDGLQCATILIGTYDRSTGLPVIGVVNQPFHVMDQQTNKWSGRVIWGISYSDVQLHCGATKQPRDDKVAVISSSESKLTQNQISKKYTLVQAAGAGYKMLCVIDLLSDVYLLSHGSTFKWDSCAPHAILRSQGGGMVDFANTLQIMKQGGQQSLLQKLYDLQVKYDKPNMGVEGAARWKNEDGLVAYSSIDDLIELLRELVR